MVDLGIEKYLATPAMEGTIGDDLFLLSYIEMFHFLPLSISILEVEPSEARMLV